MYKLYSFISLLFFANVSIGMQQSAPTPPSKNNLTQKKDPATYSNKINKKKKQVQKEKIPQQPIKNSLASTMVHKPRHVQEKKQQQFQFIYDEKTARRGAPKMLDIHCDQCNDLLIKYQKDGPGRLLRCYLDRIHSPQILKNRQHKPFNVRTSPNLRCETCLLIIGTPMIYHNETRPAYKLEQNNFYIKENK